MAENQKLLPLLTTPTTIKLAVAESLTSGNLQAAIGAISGISASFQGGITAYNLDQKDWHLGINRAFAAKCDCVHQQVADEMAKGVCKLFRADIGAATTGFAERTPVPFAFWAIYHSTGVEQIVRSGQVEGPNLTRVAMQNKVAEVVMAALLDYLQEFRG